MNGMDRISFILLLGIIIGSVVLGVAAAKLNHRVLPNTPITIQIPRETNETTAEVKALEIITLTTVVYKYYPRTFPRNPAVQKEFKQGEIMGILLNFSVAWHKGPRFYRRVIVRANESGCDEMFVYFDSKLVAHFKTTLEMYGPAGKLVASSDDFRHYAGGSRSSIGANDTFRQEYGIQIPYSWEPGTYTLKAHVKDLITNLEDSKETAVNISIGPPPEEPHPTPISTNPEDLIIGSEDLPGNWTLKGEDHNQTSFKICAMSIRYFSKAVGDFSKDFEVHIIQFETVEEAKEYFQWRLERALSAEKYGHCEVVMLDIGDDSFLCDRAERRDPKWAGWDGDSTSWATGSSVTFRKENIIVFICSMYNYEAIRQGIYVTNQELTEFARIQEAKFSSQALD